MIIGIGTDIVEVERIRESIERWGDDFLKRIFCEEEIAYAQKHTDPYQHYAARFAAKEAVFKALGDRAFVNWKAIKIVNDANGKPVCHFLEHEFDGNVLISLSHTKHYAVANAIITKKT
ncbi:MAG TPA: holo-ACP synthase [Candidatus Omnitrophota bacterium]|nr:holo-ACP synthase [Candidatus Omnitrophota bacterium]HSA31010.1 holo-ACP synthase [Candidatus Omnitrophota bacterium]